MAGSGHIGGPGIARLSMVCAVLAGLFLMHGAPASATEGCHGVMSTPMAAPAAASPHAAMDLAATGGDEAMARPGGGTTPQYTQSVSAGALTMGHGQMCVSTPARERVRLPVSGLLAVVAVLAVWALAERAMVRGRAGRRGSPLPGGRGLLLWVGVART